MVSWLCWFWFGARQGVKVAEHMAEEAAYPKGSQEGEKEGGWGEGGSPQGPIPSNTFNHLPIVYPDMNLLMDSSMRSVPS
jgi:hypothetical protein